MTQWEGKPCATRWPRDKNAKVTATLAPSAAIPSEPTAPLLHHFHKTLPVAVFDLDEPKSSQ